MIPAPDQPHTETDPAAAGGEGADIRPEWLPEQFSTPEALAKSYDESRREMDRLRTQLEEERSQWTAALDQISQTQQTQHQPQPGLDPQTNALLASYNQAVESGDSAAQLAITLGLQKQMMDAALEERFKQVAPELESQRQVDRDNAFRMAELRVAGQYGDRWQEIAPDVNKWLTEHPAFLPQANTIDAFEPVILEASRAVVNAKAAEQLAQIEQARAAKLAAQTATGGASSRHPLVTDEKKAAWDEIKGAAVDTYSSIARK